MAAARLKWCLAFGLGVSLVLGLACAPPYEPTVDMGPGRPNAEGDTGSESGGVEYGVCGNGIHEPGESCDDANEVWGDGCNPDCRMGGDLLWRDSINVGSGAWEVDALIRAADGTWVVLAGGNNGEPPLALAWHTDGSPAWVHQSTSGQAHEFVPRRGLALNSSLLVVDTYGKPDGLNNEYIVHVEELGLDGEVLAVNSFEATRGGVHSNPVSYLEQREDGARLVLEYDGAIEQWRRTGVGQWEYEEPFVLQWDAWDEILSHAYLPDGTELFVVASQNSALAWLYRVGADREVSQWWIFAAERLADLKVRGDSIFIHIQEYVWEVPQMVQFSLDAEQLGNWYMHVESEVGTTYFESASAVWVGDDEVITVGREFGDMGRQALDGEDRWMRWYLEGQYQPAQAEVAPGEAGELFIAGVAYDNFGQRHIYLEARAP